MDMDVFAGVIGGLISGLVTVYIALRMLKPNIKVAESQTELNEAQSEFTVMGAAEKAGALLTSALQYSEKHRLELQKENELWGGKLRESTNALLKSSAALNQMQDRVDELERKEGEQLLHRAEREDRLARAEERIEALGRQVLESNSRYNTLKAEYDALDKRYNALLEVFAKWLKDKNGDVPKDLADALSESVKLRIWGKKDK
jgi:chromosome segregation ATPase